MSDRSDRKNVVILQDQAPTTWDDRPAITRIVDLDDTELVQIIARSLAIGSPLDTQD